MRTHAILIAAASLIPIACGTNPEPAEEPVDNAEVSSTGSEQPEAPPAEGGVTYGANPLLNVYVQGPDPDVGEALEEGPPDAYHASLVVTNTGDAPADVRFAHIQFQVVRGEEPVPCDAGEEAVELEGPSTLGPGEAHTYRAELHCELPTPGEYEVRAYMSFAGATPERDLERYYAGSYTVRVP